MYDQYKQITNSRRVHDVRMGSAGPPECFWWGQAYVFGIIYPLLFLIEIGLTDLTRYGEDQSLRRQVHIRSGGPDKAIYTILFQSSIE